MSWSCCIRDIESSSEQHGEVEHARSTAMLRSGVKELCEWDVCVLWGVTEVADGVLTDFLADLHTALVGELCGSE